MIVGTAGHVDLGRPATASCHGRATIAAAAGDRAVATMRHGDLRRLDPRHVDLFGAVSAAVPSVQPDRE